MKRNRLLLPSTKPTEKKRVLTSANADSLIANSIPVWSTINDIDFEFTFVFNQSTSNFNSIFSRGDGNLNRIEIQITTNLDLGLRIAVGGVAHVAENINLNLVEGVQYTFKYFQSKFYVNGVEEADNSAASSIDVSSLNQDIYFNGKSYVAANGLDLSFFSLGINGETFGLNEGNGSSFKGSNGTIGTTETSASNPENYIDQTVIQEIYGTGVQRKRVLTGANGDYLSFPSTIQMNKGSEIVFNFNLPDFSVQRFLGGLDGAANFIVLQTDGAAFVKVGTALNIPTGELVIGDNSFKLRESGGTYYASVNGGTEYTEATNNFYNIDVISRRSGSSRDLIIYDFSINGEQFSLNEGNGSTFKGSLGTIGTVETSASNPENYINQNVIKPI